MNMTMQELANQVKGKTVKLVILGRDYPIYGTITDEVPEGSETAIFQQFVDYSRSGKKESLPRVIERWIFENEITDFEILKD